MPAANLARADSSLIFALYVQPTFRISLLIAIGPRSGLVRGLGMRTEGMMMGFEQDSFEAAEAFVKSSPFLVAELYEDHRLYDYLDEIG